MKIKEIIVVEGKSDTQAIQRAVEADTIETNGSAINRQTLDMIQHAQHIKGVIIFTDPDNPGERIRKIVSQNVPGCKHAFLTRQEAFGGKTRSLGIEHASPEVIRSALEKVYTESDEQEELISMSQLRDYGLIAGEKAKSRRERLGERLKIGYTNGKQLYKRLNMFRISQADFESAYQAILQEEQHG
ncbi:ribonuclease M5 [Pullulanibacillus sp. KACC 23026]|uniref:ribonuclease M5 n=1 Tax=Pullulanibacillus sp. KACC 23026 TaxID=3028315 RepID=UPI0023B14441|nr:ribonuclease M5 [Pullulanibacillus sp. KACC 23026]WEG12741.1 ribonuclease M5 [Pullulanibacillus sp. KACC 23026]